MTLKSYIAMATVSLVLVYAFVALGYLIGLLG
jgi:hypothetical protein